jgi:hypothetical protein
MNAAELLKIDEVDYDRGKRKKKRRRRKRLNEEEEGSHRNSL